MRLTLRITRGSKGAKSLRGIATLPCRRSNTRLTVKILKNPHVKLIASTLAAILKPHGYSATFFTSPLEALAAARSSAPDLLISDVAMPGISGIELAIQMRAQYPDCKILLFSGQAASMDLLEDARSQGHNFQLLQKPVHPSVMLSMIGELATENGLAGPRKSPKPVSALPIKFVPRMLRTPQYAGTS
jgi:CheY-like chemotaxis protein